MRTRLLSEGTCVCGKTIVPEGLTGPQLSFNFTVRIKQSGGIIMKELYVVNCCRTAMGSFGGSLTNISSAELGAVVVKEALNRAGVKP